MDLWQLYRDGKTAEALEGVNIRLQAEGLEDDVRSDLLLLQAWCHYRREEYQLALDSAALSNDPKAGCVTLYVMAYREEFMDRTKFEALLSELGSEVDAINAMAIDAFKNPRVVDALSVRGRALDIIATWHPDDPDVRIANIAQNTAKFFLFRYEWTGNAEDILTALTFEQLAITMYGSETNLHHRAAAHFWLSKMHEASRAFGLAVEAQAESVRLWEQQCADDPTNTGFARKHADGAERLYQLERMLND